MALELPDLVGRIRIDTSGLDNIDKHARGVGDGISGTFKKVALSIGAAFASVQIGSFLKGAVNEAREAEKLGRITENVVKQTGGAANVTAAQVGQLADRLSSLTAVDDEVIQSGANLLLTFKGVKNEIGAGNNVFDRANQAALDLAAQGFGEVTGNAVQLGKALEDPMKGLAALSRSGVTFTDQQKDQIKTLVESGKTLEAQKIILGAIEGQVGGAAAAAADPMKRLSLVANNLKETLGRALLPIVDKVGLGIGALISAFKDGDVTSDGFVGVMERIGVVMRELVPKIKEVALKIVDIVKAVVGFTQDNPAPVFAALGVVIGATLLPVIAALAASVIALLSPFVLVVAAIAALVGGVVYAYQHFETFRNIVDSVVGFMTAKFGEVKAFVAEIWPQISEAIGHAINVAAAIIRSVLGAILGFWRIFGDDIMKVVGGVFTVIKTTIETVLNVIIGVIRVVLAVINGDWGRAWEALKGVGKAALEGVVSAFKGLVDIVSGLAGGFFDAAKSVGAAILNGIVDGLKGAVGFVSDVGKAIFNGLAKLVNENIITSINNLKIDFDPPGPVGAITVDFPNLPRIPTLHSGGIVPGLPGQEVLALLEAGEQVTPASQIGQRNVTNINVESYGSNESAEDLASAIAWRLRLVPR